MKNKKKNKLLLKIKKKQPLLVLILLIFLFTQFYPLWLMLIKSFKVPTQDIYHPFTITFPFNFENYSYAWLYVKDLFINTCILAIANIFGTILVSSVTAYAFVRFKFPFKEVIFLIILSIMMIPGALTLVSQYVMINDMGLIGTRWAVILPQIAGNIPFNLFLFRTFFKNIPHEFFESAQIDGASEFKMFIKLMLPLSKPIIATAAIMLLMQSWNDLIWPMLVLNESQLTISTGLVPFTNDYEKLVGGYGAPMAGYVITSIPLIIAFFFSSKQFINGLTSGAFKM